MGMIGGTMKNDETMFEKSKPKVKQVQNQASAIADYDFGVDEYDQETEIHHLELISH